MAVFTVNGKTVTAEKNQKLLRFLRDELRLTSVKDGCSEGACGTCTVLIDGKPTKACVPQTDKLEGKNILTVEGLSDWEKKVYTWAFGEAGAVQCGFCIPGMVISAKALLDYGFANYALVSAEMPEPLQPVPVTLGQKAAVQPELQQAAPILIEKGLQAAVTRTVTLAERVEAPVAAGQQLGTLTISANGETLAEIPIIAPEAIERLTWWELTCRLLRRLCMTMPEK